jgi:polysaccharide biosynthesis transport protein
MTDIKNNTTSKSKPFDLVETLKRHWLKIVIFGTAFFLFLSPVAFLLIKPYYKVEGKIRVSPIIPSMIAQTEETSISGNYSQYVKTQIDRIKGPKIVEKAIGKLSPELKKYFLPGNASIDSAVTTVQKALDVSEIPGTYLISVQISRVNPRGITDIINNVMDVFIEEYQNEEEGKDSRRISYLSKEKERLESEIVNREKQIQKISNEITSSNLMVTEDVTAQFQSLYETAYKERVEKESLLKATIKEAEELKTASIEADVSEIVESNPLLSKIDLLAQESIHELRDTMVGMSKDNPERNQVNVKISEIENYSEEKRNIIAGKTKDLVSKKIEAELQKKIIKANAEFEAAKMTEQGLLKERNRLLTDIARITPKIIDKKQLEDSLTQMRTFLNKIYDRIQELQVESKSTGRMFIETRPVMPVQQSGDNFKKIIILIFAFSFGCSATICIIFDLLDDRVRSIKDIANVIGAIPYRPIPDYLLSGSRNITFSRVTLDDPSCEVSQSIHSLAIRLDRERKEHNAKVAVFTGVDAKSGVTEILLNAAHAVSKLCPNILVIEANLANPTLTHMHIRDTGRKGFIDILLGQMDPLKSVIHDKERDIDIMCAGRLPSPDELVRLDRAKIPPMIESLKKKYDFIIIDTIPLLVSDLTEFLLVQADMASLVIQGDRTTYQNLHSANQALSKLEVPAIATVLNWGAPRYRTNVQKVVFKYLWPIHKRIRHIVSRCVHPIPMNPYPATKIADESCKEILTP